MSRDEARGIGWYGDYLRLLPEPTPEERMAHLRVMIRKGEDRYGPNSPYVLELKMKFDIALKAHQAAKASAPR